MLPSRAPWGSRRTASSYHPNSPDAFLATPFVQPRSFCMNVPISSVTVTVPVSVPTFSNTVNETITYSASSSKVEAETKSIINNYDTNVFLEPSSITIKEQCTFSQQAKDAIINTTVGLTTATEIVRAVNLDENPISGMTSILLSGIKAQSFIEKAEQSCMEKLKNEGGSTNIAVSFPKPKM